jgi:hypothetical protein
MNQAFPQLLSLDLVLEAAKDFGLTEEEVCQTALEVQFPCWMDPSQETPELLDQSEDSPALVDQLAGALARAILDKQRLLIAAAARRSS